MVVLERKRERRRGKGEKEVSCLADLARKVGQPMHSTLSILSPELDSSSVFLSLYISTHNQLVHVALGIAVVAARGDAAQKQERDSRTSTSAARLGIGRE